MTPATDPNQLLAGGEISCNQFAAIARLLCRSIVQAANETPSPKSQANVPDDLLEWGRDFLPGYFSKPASTMHRWLGQQCNTMHRRRGHKINLIGPRGGAKSTIGTLCYVLRAALEGWEPYIWIVSDTKQQAETHLENIKTELIESVAIAHHYPLAFGRGPRWQRAGIELNNRVVIEAHGTGQRIRGRRRRAHRPTLIVCDDLQNDGHMASATLRESSSRWFHGTLLKAGTRRTNIMNLATALHRDALALQLHNTPGWTTSLFRSIETWPTNMELWKEWETLYCNRDDLLAEEHARQFFEIHRHEMEAGAVLLWPEEEDLYTLMRMRVESGHTAFEREKQGSPVDPDLCEWPDAYFEEHIWFDEWPEEMMVRAVALDPSKGADARRGDYSAIVMLGIDSQGTLFVEADLARRPTPQMVADTVAWCDRFRPDILGVEANQFQELLAGELESELKKQKVRGIVPCAIHNSVNKLVRIRRLGPLLSQRKIRFRKRSRSTELLVEQLRDFPAGAHDDGPDSLEMANRLAIEVLNGQMPNDGLGNRLPVG